MFSVACLTAKCLLLSLLKPWNQSLVQLADMVAPIGALSSALDLIKVCAY